MIPAEGGLNYHYWNIMLGAIQPTQGNFMWNENTTCKVLKMILNSIDTCFLTFMANLLLGCHRGNI